MSTLAIARQWAVLHVREQAARVYPSLDGMSRKDAARWASARNTADLGDLVIAWLGGDVTQTPGHCGPPCRETIPLIPSLTLANRAGFVTDNSQRAGSRRGRTWNAWVSGFASDDTQALLCEATYRTPLDLDSCRGDVHGCHGKPWGAAACPAATLAAFWADACPAVAAELADSWWVYIEDPEPGRNTVLWPALEAFAVSAVTS